MKKLAHILPFMESEEIRDLAFKILEGEVKGIKLEITYPFLDNEDLEKIVDLLIEKNDAKHLNNVIPFISQEKIEEIQDKIIKGEITGINEYLLYPFLGKDKLKEMYKSILNEAMNDKDSDEDE